MRIGVDACCWSNRRGFGRFTRELLRAMVAADGKHEYLFFSDQTTADASEFPRGAQKITVRTEAAPTSAASAAGRRSIRDLCALTRQVMKHELDLFFFPAVYSYFPVLNRSKIIVTLHDVIAELHPDLVFPNRRRRLFWDLKRKLAVRQADLILTVSEHSRRQLVRVLRLKENRVRHISEAADPVFDACARPPAEFADVLQQYGLGSGARFLLYVGGISPHKNLTTLVEAFDQLIAAPSFAGVKLVLAGDHKDDPFYSAYGGLRDQIRKKRLEEKVVFTGFVPDAQLAALYRTAAAFVFPSLEEGFGLPAIEAMASGAPVVCSNRGSLPEIVADAGVFFEPTDAAAIAKALGRVLSDDARRNRMREQGLQRAALFTWRKAAVNALEIFEEVAAAK